MNFHHFIMRLIVAFWAPVNFAAVGCCRKVSFAITFLRKRYSEGGTRDTTFADCCFCRIRRPACRPGERDRSGSHPLVDLGRRGRGRRRAGQGLRRHRQSLGGWRHRRLRRHGAPDHDQPHYRRRSHGRHAIQPWPPGGGAGAGRVDARPDGRRHQGEVEGHRQAGKPAGFLHHRRQDLLRAGQYPFLAVAVAVERRLQEGRRRRAEELG